MEYYPAIKMNKWLLYQTTWMNCTNNILFNERSQILKNQYIPCEWFYLYKVKKLVKHIMLKVSIMINFGMFKNLTGASEVLVVFFDLGIGSMDVFSW